ncbi:hypothetical protein GIB67_006369 [Kingdonia uniflora]|uniref:DUF7722 domain-containing protein n=1 Tax=Kingdonia uniflora TaxID=39325 RepID=A0A7J7P101_9MAGN|nr:hypothetical protein GIB67_006369 [Kingdonia uniflora]
MVVMESILSNKNGGVGVGAGAKKQPMERCGSFQMPLHYPRYTKSDYETMPEWKLDRLLGQYGLPLVGDVEEKRNFAVGTFLWS